MNGKRFLWVFAVFLGFSLVFSHPGMAQTGSGPSAADPNYRFKFIGAEVFSIEGEDLGKVVDVALNGSDAAQNMSSFIILDPNVSELKGKYVAVPFSISQNNNFSELFLPITKDELAHAPNFTHEQWPMGVKSRWATDSYRYFGQNPYFGEEP